MIIAAAVSAACTSTPADLTQLTPGAATAMSLSAAISAELDTAIQDAMVAGSAPGAIVAVNTPEGRFVHAYGRADTADGLDLDPAMTTRIGSITKTFTVTAVLQLVDEGKLGLDDPIGDYLPGVPNGDTISIRHLAGMRSGLPDYTSDPDFRIAYGLAPDAGWQPDQLLTYVFADPVLFEPGERFHYSSTNTILLGQLIEKISGTTLSDYLDTRILDPVGLPDTNLPNNATLPEPHMRGYHASVETTAWNPTYGWAAGGMVSTVDDLGRWIEAVADGSLLSAETQQARMDFQPTDNPTFGYGLGLIEHDGWIHHTGSMPGYQTFAGYQPDAGVGLVIAINTDITAYAHGKDFVPVELLTEAVTTILTPDSPFTAVPV
jgi:D-alanyl-D-alanine carboxypeptidase